MSNFMERDTPNFIWKSENAFKDYGIIIESELPEIRPKPRIQTTSVLGRSGELNEWYGDYDPFDLSIGKCTVEYDGLEAVKRWLRGNGRLITHNDPDKYYLASADVGTEMKFENEIGVFYNFSIVFRCQPLKRKLYESPKLLSVGSNIIIDHGTEIARPFFEIESNGGDIEIIIKNRNLKLLDTFSGPLTVDTELGKYVQNNDQRRSKGEWPLIHPGENNITLKGNIKSASVLLRSVWA